MIPPPNSTKKSLILGTHEEIQAPYSSDDEVETYLCLVSDTSVFKATDRG